MLDCYSMPFSTNRIECYQKQRYHIGVQMVSVTQFCQCLGNDHSRKCETWRRERMVWYRQFINSWQAIGILSWDINSGFPHSVIRVQSPVRHASQKNSWILSVQLNVKSLILLQFHDRDLFVNKPRDCLVAEGLIRRKNESGVRAQWRSWFQSHGIFSALTLSVPFQRQNDLLRTTILNTLYC
jgi:hypothetical protein